MWVRTFVQGGSFSQLYESYFYLFCSRYESYFRVSNKVSLCP